MRGLPALFKAAVTSSNLIYGHAIEMDFPSGFERINTTPTFISINGNNFASSNGGIGIAAIKESNNISDQGISITLSGLDPAHIATLMNDNPQGRLLRVWEIVLKPDHTLDAAYAVGMWRMDTLSLSLGKVARVTLRAGSAWTAWDKTNVRTYTDGDQKSRYPNDAFFNQLLPSIDKTILWGRV